MKGIPVRGLLFVVVCRGYAQHRTEERVNGGDGADYLFGIGEVPDTREGKIESAYGGEPDQGDCLENVLCLI